MLQFWRIQQVLLTDTLVTKVNSRRGTWMIKFFGAFNGWMRAFPIKKESEERDALSLLFQQVGVPPSWC